MKFEFSDHIFGNYSHIRFLNIRLVGAELCYADGQTHTTNPMVAFRNFAKAPKETKPLTQLTVVATYQ
jgi:hypothetical protein